MNNKILAFSHIPKNAGSFFTYLLRSYYGVNHCRAIATDGLTYSYSDLIQDSKVYQNLRSISGHQVKLYSNFREFEERIVWAVLIRDPYSRFPSQYKWWCKRNQSEISFKDWCELKGDKFSNLQSKWICGVADHKKAIDVIHKKNVIIGFQNDLERFVHNIVIALQLKEFPWKKDLTVNDSKILNGEFERHLIEKYNEEDLALYEELLKVCTKITPFRKETLKEVSVNKVNFYLNVFKHVFVYRPYRKLLTR